MQTKKHSLNAQRLLWLALFAVGLLVSACSTVIPAIEAVSPVSGYPGVAALGQNTNDDGHRRLTTAEWVDFLYARGEIPNPKDPTKKLPAKGPAVCVSSDDWRKNETAIAQFCENGKCTYEQKKALVRMQGFHNAVSSPAK